MVRTSVTHSAIASCATLLFLPHFDVICDLFLNRCTATWNLFFNYRSGVLSPNIIKHATWLHPSTDNKCNSAITTSNLLSIQMKQPHWLLCVAKEFWLVQENHATVKLVTLLQQAIYVFGHYLFLKASNYSSSFALGKLFPSWDSPRTNIRTYFLAKWRLQLIYNPSSIFAGARLVKTSQVPENSPAKTGRCPGDIPNFPKHACCKNIWRIINTITSIWSEDVFEYLSLEAHSFPRAWTVWLSEPVMSTDQYPCPFSGQIEDIAHIHATPACGIIVKFNQSLGYPILLKVTSWQCNQTHRWKMFSWPQKSSGFVSLFCMFLLSLFALNVHKPH